MNTHRLARQLIFDEGLRLKPYRCPAGNEVWSDISGFPGYRVSTLGNVQRIAGGRGARVGKSLGWVQRRGGYSRVCVALRRDGRTFIVKVHQLVLTSFVRAARYGEECLHRDGNPLNNKIENLSWGSHQENVQDSIAHGTHVAPPIHIGDSHPNAKITENQISEMRSRPLIRGEKAKIARELGLSQTHVGRLLAGKGRVQL